MSDATGVRGPSGASLSTSDRPFSIVRRMMALVAGVSLLSVGLYAAALYVVLQPFSVDVAERLIGQVGSFERAMRAVPSAGRDAFAAAIRTDRVSIGRSPPAASLVAPDDRPQMPATLRQRLDAGLGRKTQVVIGPDVAGSFDASFDLPVEGDTWWLTVGGVRPSLGRVLVPIFGSVALIAIAAGLTLLVGVRLVTRPMSRLAHELLARRSALTPIEEPPRASVELQGVIRSFNEMVAAVAAAERSRHDLLAGVSHDLRTPLARLRLRAEVQGPPDLAETMEPDFIAMSRIIDQFLAYAQGQVETAPAPRYPLNELVEAVVAGYRDEGVDLRFEAGPDRGAAFSEVVVQRTLGNLIDNARSHGVEPIEVAVLSRPGEVGLIVYDAGPGIAADAFAQAQQPFVRLQPEMSRDGHCGLGLAIVREVVERLHGHMALQPYDGQRSGVGVWLPLPDGPGRAPGASAVANPAAAGLSA